jgi:hypothetical protein
MGAFKDIEKENKRVSDMILDASTYHILRKYCKYSIDTFTHPKEIRKGLFGVMWGVNLWVNREATGIICFCENSEELIEQFPSVAEAKKELNR